MPGHTRGSVSYRLRGKHGRDCLMTGDALFCAGGCGAPFEACKGELERNLVMVLRECSDETLIFPGHEYTSKLLSTIKLPDELGASTEFALLLCGAKETTIHRQRHDKPEDQLPTIPLRLSEERCFQLLGPMAGQRLLQHVFALQSVLVHPPQLDDAISLSADSSEDSDSKDGYNFCDLEDRSIEPMVPQPNAPALVLGHGLSPHVNPFVCLFRSDFERLCTQLEAVEGSSAVSLAQELRKAPMQLGTQELQKEVLRRLGRRPRKGIPDVAEIEESLLALAVDNNDSIGREACRDLARLRIDELCLRQSLTSVCGAEYATFLLGEAPAETWQLSIREAAWKLHDAARERRPKEPGCRSYVVQACNHCCQRCSSLFKKSIKIAKKEDTGTEKDHDSDGDSDTDSDSIDFGELAKDLLGIPKHDICDCKLCASGLPAKRFFIKEVDR